MITSKSYPRLAAVALLALCLLWFPLLHAQTAPTAHNLTLSNVTQSIDQNGRVVLLAKVTGDLQGVLTVAMSVSPSGAITSGDWALNVSYISYGAPILNGDGDPGETLVQLGVIKGTVDSGNVTVDENGLASAMASVQLTLTGATLHYAGVTSGSGTLNGSSLDANGLSAGSVALTF